MSLKLASKKLVSSDGIEIYAESVGNPLKPHVVFVHGFTLSGAVFDRIFHDAEHQASYYLVRLYSGLVGVGSQLHALLRYDMTCVGTAEAVSLMSARVMPQICMLPIMRLSRKSFVSSDLFS